MTNEEAYKRIENIVFKYEEKELSSLDDRKLNNEALNHIREALKKADMRGEEKMTKRTFQKIIVEYPKERTICCYPEYQGKPYFSILFKENGKELEGFGTYNPDVLSRYIRDYFIDETENDKRNDDLISREDLKKAIMNDLGLGDEENGSDAEYMCGLQDCYNIINNAPTVELENIQSKLISKVAHSIAEQYLRHNEVVPEWLTIGDIRV